MRLAVPDLISNSYFPAVAAVELGFFREEGLDVELELLFPVTSTMQALRDGELAFVAGAAHATLGAFPEWQGAKLLVALAQNMYWMLVLRSDLQASRGDINAVKGLRIGAAPGPDAGLRQMLIEAGIVFERDQVEVGPIPGTNEPGVSFGVTAARALEEGLLDGFWANAMGAEVAVRRGIGTIVLDVRRGDDLRPLSDTLSRRSSPRMRGFRKSQRAWLRRFERSVALRRSCARIPHGRPRLESGCFPPPRQAHRSAYRTGSAVLPARDRGRDGDELKPVRSERRFPHRTCALRSGRRHSIQPLIEGVARSLQERSESHAQA